MARPVEPVEIEGGCDGTVYKHPAFGQISLHRVSGGGQTLYGSDFEHSNSIRIEIHRSELHRSLSHDWPFQKKELIEIAMSEAQWATFVSSMSVGGGVQCTITAIDGRYVPGFELPSKQEMFSNEVADKLRKTVEGFRKTLEEIDSLGIPKGKAAKLKEPFHTAIRELLANMPFVAESFDKHMEKTVERAKVEIHGYMSATLQRAGLEAIQAPGGAVLEIKDESKGGAN